MVAVVNPQAALQRTVARARYSAARYVFGRGGYDGARKDRGITKGWDPKADGPIGSLVSDLPALRYRTRDLERNAPLARSVTNTYCARVIGTGLWPRARLDREFLGLTDEAATALERRIDRYFWTVAQSGALDYESRLPWTAQLKVVLRAKLTGGDVFAVRRYDERAGDVLGTRVQLIEADRVDNPPTEPVTTLFAGGVERDESGLPIAIHVRDTHPGEDGIFVGGEFTRVPFIDPELGDRQVLHVLDAQRIGQPRGEPILAPVIETFHGLREFNNAELRATILNSFFTAIVTSKTGEMELADLESADLPKPTARSTAVGSDIRLGSGTVAYLAEGESIQFADPKRPNHNAEGFVRAFCSYAGAATGIPREVLLKEFTASYSAARAALLDMWSSVMDQRTQLTDLYCQPIYEWVLGELVDRGVLAMPGFHDDPVMRAAWSECEWIGPTMGQIDPVDEVDAASRRVSLGVSTLSEVTAELTGGDWEMKHQQRVKEVRMRQRDGLDVEPVAERVRTELSETGDGDDELPPAPRKPPVPEGRLRGDARDRTERLASLRLR